VLVVGGVVVALGVAVSAAVDRDWKAAVVAAVAVALLIGGATVAPAGRDTGRTLSAALVQGGGPQGTRDEDVDDREVFERHLEASAAVPAGVDLTLWPEDVVDTDGYVVDAAEGDDLAELARRLRTTLVAGVVETEDDESFHNASMVWDRTGTVVDRYEKVQRVPFGEWVPFRGVLEPFAGDALPQRDAIVGEGPAVVVTPRGTLGVAISWEVFFGHRAREGVLEGAGALINPTNGASFTGTIVQSQQIASSQLRAIETGRWVAQIAPTGFTAFITPDGRVLERTGVSERAVPVHDLALRTGLTPYTRLGDRPFIALGVALVAAAWALTVRSAGRARGSELDEHGDGAVVDELDGHVGAEATGGDGRPQMAQGIHHGVDERLGHRRRGGPDP
jgi:apolipoprotein N-acyltransferase